MPIDPVLVLLSSILFGMIVSTDILSLLITLDDQINNMDFNRKNPRKFKGCSANFCEDHELHH